MDNWKKTTVDTIKKAELDFMLDKQMFIAKLATNSDLNSVRDVTRQGD